MEFSLSSSVLNIQNDLECIFILPDKGKGFQRRFGFVEEKSFVWNLIFAGL
jgi:hypothetical protein